MSCSISDLKLLMKVKLLLKFQTESTCTVDLKNVCSIRAKLDWRSIDHIKLHMLHSMLSNSPLSSSSQSTYNTNGDEVPGKGDDDLSERNDQERIDSGTHDVNTAGPSINTDSENINTWCIRVCGDLCLSLDYRNYSVGNTKSLTFNHRRSYAAPIDGQKSDKRAGYGDPSRSDSGQCLYALRLILQCGVKPSWFNTYSSIINKGNSQLSKSASSSGDRRSYSIDIPTIGDSVVPELLLKVLEPYQREGEVPGSILDDERVRQYATILDKGSAARFSFALGGILLISSSSETDDASLLSRISSKGKSATSSSKRNTVSDGELRLMAFEQEELWESSNERIPWHERLDDEEAIQNCVHELVSIGNLEAAVSLMLSTPPESPYFYPNALRAVALLSAVSRSLNELAVKVVAANMVETDRSLSGTHLLCAVGRYQEACSQILIGVSKLYKSWAMSRRPSRVEVVGQLAGYKMQDAGQMLIPSPTPLLY
ncbi:transducin/WD40 repeat family protein [Tanacetum coccineum]|uniref:Transducin/WD40 repeat family protein n=1 Tax=Tanacetum coccineum TaxID=301880 RepID=A0ABQ5AV80_9ASTR